MLDLDPIKARLLLGGYSDIELEVYAPADLAALVAEVERLRAVLAELEAEDESSEALDGVIWEGCFGPMSGEWGSAGAKA